MHLVYMFVVYNCLLVRFSRSESCTPNYLEVNPFAREHHKDFCSILKEPLLLQSILFGVGGTICTTTHWNLFRSWVLTLKSKILASKLHVHSVNYTAKLVHTRRALPSTKINSDQEPVASQACNPLFFSSVFFGGGVLQYLLPTWLLFRLTRTFY